MSSHLTSSHFISSSLLSTHLISSQLPENADKTDFLQKVAIQSAQKRYLAAGLSEEKRKTIPRNASEFALRFRDTKYFQATKEELSKPTAHPLNFDDAPFGQKAYYTEEYSVGCCRSTAIATERQLRWVRRGLSRIHTIGTHRLYACLLHRRKTPNGRQAFETGTDVRRGVFVVVLVVMVCPYAEFFHV